MGHGQSVWDKVKMYGTECSMLIEVLLLELFIEL